MWLCIVSGQFYEQADDMRTSTGKPFAHYKGTQHGALRLCSMDGQAVVAPHALFTVKEFAADKVLLVAAYPPDLKGKLVEVTVHQWVHMFKMVNDLKGNHPKRLLRAMEHDRDMKLLPPKTHPCCEIVLAMHIDNTTPNMNIRTNTSFDVRGMPLVPGGLV